jgi:MazG family protein
MPPDNDDRASAAAEFAKLLAIVAELRTRCPWDRDQKLTDTPRHLIEEAYEVADAVARGDASEIADELGDLIAQSLFVATILGEESQLDMAAVLKGASEKLIRRHPHIYAGTRADTVEQVLENWDQIKQREREDKDRRKSQPVGVKSIAEKSIGEVGRALPALMRAEKLGAKARRAGMDWAGVREVLAKAREEIAEVEHALDRGDTDGAAEEIGDLMLAIANAPRFIARDAEQTLRAACDKFVTRFDQVARLAAARGLDLKVMPPEAIEALWDEAKQMTRGSGRR